MNPHPAVKSIITIRMFFGNMFERYYPLHYKPIFQDRGNDYLQYAEMYKNVVEILLDNTCSIYGYEFKNLPDGLNTSHGHDYEILPLLFNFRHYIELQLTGLILYGSNFSPNLNNNLENFLVESRSNHSLMKLYDKLKTVEIDKIYFPQTLTRLITNLDKLDHGSDRFRYPEDSFGFKFYETDEVYNSNKRFYENLTKLSSFVDYVTNAISSLENLKGYFEYLKDNNEQTLEHDMDNYLDTL